MRELAELLGIPRRAKWPWVWERLTTSDTLFRALREAMQSDVACDWAHFHDLLLWWREKFIDHEREQKKQEKLLSQWDLVRALVWCAEQAAMRPDFYRTEIDRVCFALASVPDFIKCREGWAWICIRSLLLDAPQRRVNIPVAGWDQRQGKNGGFLATLVLEVLGRGAGQVAHHPADVFCTAPDGQFCTSMDNAWAAAWALLKQDVNVERYDGCWRLLKGWSWEEQEREKLLPAAEANGRSASGAATRGWWFALTKKVPGDGVIVVAQVDENDVKLIKGFGGEGVYAKTKTIVAAGSFDTIVVASGEDEQAALRALGKGSHIRAVNLDASNA